MAKPPTHLYEFGPFRMDPVKRQLLRDETIVPLTRKAFDMLLLLVRNRGKALGKDEMMKTLWPDTIVEEANLTQNIFMLRKTLGESSDDHQFIETIPRLGYRFIAEVTQRELQIDPNPAVQETTLRSLEGKDELATDSQTSSEATVLLVKTPASKLSQLSRRNLAVLLILTGLAVALAYTWLTKKSSQPGVVVLQRSVAVLPFRQINAAGSDEHLELGIADALITKLSSIRKLVVRPTSAIRKYSRSDQDAVSTGRDLGVESVMEGTIQRSDDRIRITVQLISVRDGSTQWAEKYDERFTNIFAVQDAIAEKLAAALTLKLTREERTLLTKRYTDNSEAYELYLRGYFEWNRFTPEGLKNSIDYYTKAINVDPRYALAYSALAASYGVLGNTGHVPPRESYPLAKSVAQKAVDLDPALAEIHAPMAPVNLFYEWDWSAAEKEFKRLLEFNPDFSHAHLLYGYYLAAMGRLEDAKAETTRARALEPLSPLMNMGAGLTQYFSGQYDQAIQESRSALNVDSNFLLARLLLGHALEEKGMFEQAIAEFESATAKSNRDPMALASLAHVYAVSGKRREAERILDELKTMSNQRYVSPYNLAVIYAGLGMKEESLTWLDKSYEVRDYRMIWLKVEPQFDSLRSDPGFVALLQRMKLPVQ